MGAKKSLILHPSSEAFQGYPWKELQSTAIKKLEGTEGNLASWLLFLMSENQQAMNIYQLILYKSCADFLTSSTMSNGCIHFHQTCHLGRGLHRDREAYPTVRVAIEFSSTVGKENIENPKGSCQVKKPFFKLSKFL